MRKIIVIAGLLLVIILGLLFFKPDVVSEEFCDKVTGVVTEIKEGGVKDAIITLSGNETVFYINRALESRFTIQELQEQLVNKKVTIYFVENAFLFNIGVSEHIKRMDVEEKVFYTEF